MNEQQLAAVKQAVEALMVFRYAPPAQRPLVLKAIADLEQAIAQDALYKMAEDAVTTGLSYNDWPKIGCVNHDCDQCRGVQEPVASYCCHSCFKLDGGFMLDRMILCPECGNKRCPKASDHQLDCTGSDEPNQPGSVYTAPPAPQPVPVKTYHDGKPWPVAPKPWVGLTDDDIHEQGWNLSADRDYEAWTGREFLVVNGVNDFARAIEAKLKEKNHG